MTPYTAETVWKAKALRESGQTFSSLETDLGVPLNQIQKWAASGWVTQETKRALAIPIVEQALSEGKTLAQASALAGVSVPTLHNWRKAGYLNVKPTPAAEYGKIEQAKRLEEIQPKLTLARTLIAEGQTYQKVANSIGVTLVTLNNWMQQGWLERTERTQQEQMLALSLSKLEETKKSLEIFHRKHKRAPAAMEYDYMSRGIWPEPFEPYLMSTSSLLYATNQAIYREAIESLGYSYFNPTGGHRMDSILSRMEGVDYVAEFGVLLQGRQRRVDYQIQYKGFVFFLEVDGVTHRSARNQYFARVQKLTGVSPEESLRLKQQRDAEVDQWFRERNYLLARVSFEKFIRSDRTLLDEIVDNRADHYISPEFNQRVFLRQEVRRRRAFELSKSLEKAPYVQ